MGYAVLMPAFALFFPVPVAVAATAVVHLANNLFKVALVGRKADWAVVLRFAIPECFCACSPSWRSSQPTACLWRRSSPLSQ